MTTHPTVGATSGRPYILFGQLPTTAKSLRSLRIYICSGRGKTVQIISLRYYFVIKHNFYMLIILKSAPSRLTPNEALPQAPLRALPISCERSRTRNLLYKPSNAGLEPAFYLSLRSVVGAQLWSALPIPHSSLLTPHS